VLAAVAGDTGAVVPGMANATYRRRLQMMLRNRHRLAEVPGLGLDLAQQRIAEIGSAAVFPSGKHLAAGV
jgi:transposase